MSLSEPLREQISELVAQNRVILFMKGTRRMPQCGFSAQVVNILDALLPSYETVDALRSPEIRDGIKAFSQWPTISTLYRWAVCRRLRHRPRDECVRRAAEAHRRAGLGEQHVVPSNRVPRFRRRCAPRGH